MASYTAIKELAAKKTTIGRPGESPIDFAKRVLGKATETDISDNGFKVYHGTVNAN